MNNKTEKHSTIGSGGGMKTKWREKKSAEKEAEEAEQEKKAGNGVKTDAQVTKKGQRTRGQV